MPYEKFVEPWPDASKHPTVFGCMPPIWVTVGVGSIWRCEYCGQRWERTTSPAWSKIYDAPTVGPTGGAGDSGAAP